MSGICDSPSTGSDVRCRFRECFTEPGDILTFVASILMALGLVFMTVGYVIPRDFEFDPYAPAREMEAIEIYFTRLSHDLDVLITVGMGFAALGGIIMTSLVTYEMYNRMHEEDEEEVNYVQLKSVSRQPSYGAAGVTTQTVPTNSREILSNNR